MSDEIAHGRKIVLRKKRIEDAEEDYRWRTDPELAELDAAVVLRQPFDAFHRDYEHEFAAELPWVRRYAVDTLDGITIDAFTRTGWWFNVRKSNTEPLLRLNAEAKDARQLGTLIESLSPKLGARVPH